MHAAAHEDGPLVLVRHDIWGSSIFRDDPRRVAQRGPGLRIDVDRNDNRSVVPTRTPEIVLIVAAECRRKSRAVEIDRCGVTVVRSEYRRPRAISWGQVTIDVADIGGKVAPPEF